LRWRLKLYTEEQFLMEVGIELMMMMTDRETAKETETDPVRMYSVGARLDLLRRIKSVTAYSVVLLATCFTQICFFLIAFSPSHTTMSVSHLQCMIMDSILSIIPRYELGQQGFTSHLTHNGPFWTQKLRPTCMLLCQTNKS